MSTKFIGKDGYQEIESLPFTRRKPQELNTAQKTVRFIKRAGALAAKKFKIKSTRKVTVKRNVTKPVAKRQNKPAVQSKPVMQTSSKRAEICYFDRRYSAARQGINFNDTDNPTLKLVTATRYKNDRKYAHAAPVSKASVHKAIKKKAMLASVACLTAAMIGFASGASALSVPPTEKKATVQSAKSSGYSYVDYTSNEFSSIATADEATDTAEKAVTNAVLSNNIGAQLSALYINGKKIGVTGETSALGNALNKILSDAKEGYDENTTADFANTVKIINGKFPNETVLTADEVLELAKDYLYVAVTTDVTDTISLNYDTQYDYDDSKSNTYSEAKQEGENGEAEVTYKVTYINGEQTNSVETARNVTKEPKNEIIVQGTSEAPSYEATGSFMWPLPYTHNIVSYYGYRWGRLHSGIDISDDGIGGQDIVAADGGTVTWAGYDDSGYGNYVIIDHGNGYYSLYGHCSSLAVSQGDKVYKGQTVAYVGSTGDSTGEHLHFEIRRSETDRLDPMEFL